VHLGLYITIQIIEIKLIGHIYKRILNNLITTTFHEEKLENFYQNLIVLGLMSMEIGCSVVNKHFFVFLLNRTLSNPCIYLLILVKTHGKKC